MSNSSPASSALAGARTRIGQYELGRTLGEGNFAKVKYARHVRTGHAVAIKILNKEKILKHNLVDKIKREISIMKLVKHPNIVQLYEILASKTKIYFVLELVTGGELFNKLRIHGKLSETEARKYFQQLINAVDYCHSRGIYHRDLKPENLLLDEDGTMKISDFGLSAFPDQCRKDELLHTTCGTPNYVAPEVIHDKAYDGAKADLWSCGVVLFVLMAGYLPFDESNILQLYKKIRRAEYACPPWFSTGARHLVSRLLTSNAKHRITVSEILDDPWFRKGYKPAKYEVDEDIKLDDVDAVFSEANKDFILSQSEEASKPTHLNAFELISLSRGLNLSPLFEWSEAPKLQTRFTSRRPAHEIISKMEETARPLGFNVQKRNYKMKLRSAEIGKNGRLSIATEVFEVAPSFFVVEMHKACGDTLEYHKFYESFSVGLKDIVWSTEDQ